MKAIIVDDERLALRMMEKLLSEQTGTADNLEVVGTFQDPYKALKAVQQETIDLAFLDIEMPGIDGFELAEQLVHIQPHLQIIFVTAYRDYAVKAFELNALDYLLKPVNHQRLAMTLQRVEESTQKHAVNNIDASHTQATLCCLQNMHYLDTSGHMQTFPWRTLKAPELFAYLVYFRDKTVTKETLIDLLWSEYDTKRSTTQLYTAIYQIRKILKESGLDLKIKYQDEGYRLVWGEVKLDVEEWENSVRQAPPVTSETLEEHLLIMERYTGDFLLEHRYWWAEHEQERIRLIWLKYVKEIAEYYTSLGKYTEAISLYQKIRETLPYLEDGYFGLMNIYAALNHPLEVIKQFELISIKCKEELDVTPSKEITDWYYQWKSSQ
ncbi:response regulator [Brevibacillus daliensis]|uniref:response regulator n=1 Tax=Brevibacillus daliensis TaxID=2892995 RepID=UPI001E30B6EB|nr:response regulator [Brevibacillus daliensis]